MPSIPIATFTARPGPLTGVRVNPNAYEGQYDAARRLAGTVSQAGDMTLEFAQRIQQAEDYKHKASLETALHAAYGDFQNGLQSQPDETRWQNDWQKRLEKTLKVAMPTKMAARTRAEITAYVDHFKQSTRVEVDHLALARGISKAKQAGENRLDQALREQDLPAFDQTLTQGVQAGLWSQPDAEKMRVQAGAKMATYAASDIILKNPVAAVEQLTDQTDGGRWRYFKELDETHRRILTGQAKAALSRNQSETRDDMLNAVDGGQIITDQTIETAELAKAISPAGAKGIRTRIAQKNLADARDDSFVARGAIDDWETATDKSPEETARELGDSISHLPPALRLPLAREIKRKLEASRKHEEISEHSVKSDTIARMKADPLMSGAKDIKELTEHFGDQFVMTDADVQKRYHKSREEAVRDLQMKQARQLDQLRQWFDDYPKTHKGQYPSEEEAEGYRQRIVLGPKIDAAADQVTQHAQVDPAAVQKIQENLAAGREWHEGSTMPVRVTAPNGQVGTIPAAKLKAALAAGYKLVE
jgi:hypothetical protein